MGVFDFPNILKRFENVGGRVLKSFRRILKCFGKNINCSGWIQKTL